MSNLAMDLPEIFATAYAQAARANADMREAVATFESIRSALTSSAPYHEVFAIIDDAVGQADLTRIVPAVVEIRRAYLRHVTATETARLVAEFDADPVRGWVAWLRAYADVFQETSWHTLLGLSLARTALVSSPVAEWPVERVRQNALLVDRQRWRESYEWLDFLANHPEIPAAPRARLLAVTAEMHLYQFVQPSQAELRLTQAEALAPSDHIVQRDRADFLFADADDSSDTAKIEGARKLYQSVAERRPRLADGYVGLGDCALRQNDPVAAEAFYQQAVQFAPGDSTAHQELLHWYAQQRDERDDLIEPVFARLVALSDNEAASSVVVGAQHEQAARALDESENEAKQRKYAKARARLTHALELQPDNASASESLGYIECDLAGANGEDTAAAFERAASHFRRVIEQWPQSVDGYRGMAYVAEKQDDLDGALRWLEQAVSCHPQCESYLLVSRAAIHMRMKRWQPAVEDLARSIAIEPRNSAALSTMLSVAEAANDAGANDEATEILARWRRTKGAAADVGYHNTLGNWCYDANKYLDAEKHYQDAINADPTNAVVRSNHALAAKELRTQFARLSWLDVAIADLTEASRLDPGRADYRERLGRFERERDFVLTYGEEALQLTPTVTPIAVEVAESLLPFLLNPGLSQLSDDSFARIDAWRNAFRVRYGVAVPGIRFRRLDASESGTGITVSIMERTPTRAEPAAHRDNALELILNLVEEACRTRLADFLGHQETATLLRQAGGDAAQKILDDVALLRGFVATVRRAVSDGAVVTDLSARVDAFIEQRRGSTTVTGERLPAAELQLVEGH